MNLPEDQIPAKAVILDRDLIRHIYAERTAFGNHPHDEVWEGTLVLSPLPDNEQRLITMCFAFAFGSSTSLALPGANVSDRDAEWCKNFRCPDIVVYLPTNPAKDCGTHWMGGPDHAVEITSAGEDPRQKLDFYAKVNTQEVLIVHRDPWAVELYLLQAGKLVLVGTSDATTSAVLASVALPLTFQMQPGTPRPTILISHTTSQQTWTA